MNLFSLLAGAISLTAIVTLCFAIPTEIHPRHASTFTLMSHQIPVQDDGSVSGWVKEPALRGTWKVVWTCLATTFLCIWTLLCLNIPAPTDTWFVLFRRRLLWMILAILGPEIVLTYAAGQWSRARHSLAAFKNSGYEGWTMRLAFFADMGGFVLETAPDPEDDNSTISFPLNAKQLHWLVVNKHLSYPLTTSGEVNDKSKQDRLAKLITSIQIGYLVVECVARAAQGLVLTTLELNTLAIVVCSLMTSYTWLHKPVDVRHPIRLCSPHTLTEITGRQPWDTTPLDFVDENGPGWALNVQPFVRMPVLPAQRPLQRIPNDRFPMDPYGAQEYLLCLATLVFTGLHLAAWDFEFPSRAEQILWRVSSLVLFLVTAAFWVAETAASWVRLGRWRRLYLLMVNPEKLAILDLQSSREDEKAAPAPRKAIELPLAWEFWTIAPIAFLYGVARVYQVLEGFLQLRHVDATVFVHVPWSMYFPHV
ncbi:hypothetical protein MCOR23_004718 [Pyricularia oryzae]|nr:hypothetical protein MCOR23_004718 [Pyricularia oryzae]